jgi:hypothetical protein
MLFRIICDCGHEGLAASLPRRLKCSACGDTRLFRVADGDPILRKLAAEREQHETDVAAFLAVHGAAAE